MKIVECIPTAGLVVVAVVATVLVACPAKTPKGLVITLDEDGRIRSFDNTTVRKVELQAYTHDGVTTLNVHWVKNP